MLAEMLHMHLTIGLVVKQEKLFMYNGEHELGNGARAVEQPRFCVGPRSGNLRLHMRSFSFSHVPRPQKCPVECFKRRHSTHKIKENGCNIEIDRWTGRNMQGMRVLNSEAAMAILASLNNRTICM